MEKAKQPVFYSSYGFQPSFVTPNINATAHGNTLYSTADPEDDPDVFLMGSTCDYRLKKQICEQEYDYGVTYAEDAMLNTLDLAPEDEVTTKIHPSFTENGVIHSNENRIAQLEQETESLRRQNQELLSIIQSYQHKPFHQQNGYTSDGDVDEVIEEEHRTIQHKRPSVPTFDEEIQCNPKPVRSIGVGNFNIHRYHLIDLDSETIDENQFPQEYWARLVESFKEHARIIKPLTRDVTFQSINTGSRTTATMVSPKSEKERLCFGVTVRPVTHDIGVGCSENMTRDFGCTTHEASSNLDDAEKKLHGLTQRERKTVKELLKKSTSSHAEFIECILKFIRKELRTVGINVRPDTRCSFTMTRTDNVTTPMVSVAMPVVKESKLVEARPVQVNKSLMTVRRSGITVFTETSSPLLRSQGTQTEHRIQDTTTCGVQTEPCPLSKDLPASPVQVDHSLMTVSRGRNAHSQERMLDSKQPTDDADRGVSHRRTGSYDENFGDVVKTSKFGSTFSHSVHLHASRPMSPDEVREMFPAYFSSASPLSSTKSVPTEVNQPTTEATTMASSHPDGYTISSERRLVNEQSVRHLLPDDVDLNDLTRGDPAAMEDALSRSKPIATSHFIREFHPTIEVIPHGEVETMAELHTSTDFGKRYSREKPEEGFTSDDRTTAEVEPSTTLDEQLDKPSSESYPVEIKVIPISSETSGPSEGIRAPLHVQTRSDEIDTSDQERITTLDGSTPRIYDSSGGAAQSGSDVEQTRDQNVEHQHTPTRLPPRNHSYTMPAEAIAACESLRDYYSTASRSTPDSNVKSNLRKLSDLWLELTTSSTSVSLAELEDFLATLNSYHPDLLRDVIQSSDEQGLTSLHLAVGHGAWPVVNLILDSGYAQPDCLNRNGYSPIMISTFGSTPSAAGLSTLNRLYSLGNVNLPSTAGSGQTPLMLAAQNHSVEIVELLLQHHAAVNAQDRAGNTALMFAIQQSDREIVDLLLDNPDLDLSLMDNRGEDALTIAIHRGDPSIIDWIRNALKSRTRKSALFAMPPSHHS